MFSPAAGDLLPDVYCPGQDRRNPLLSPLFGNWNGLPPLLFHAGSTEMLLDDSIRAHDRAVQAGVAAEIEVFVALPHVFQMITWLPEARVANRAIADFIVERSARRRDKAGDGVERAVGVGQHAGMELEHVPAARVLLETRDHATLLKPAE